MTELVTITDLDSLFTIVDLATGITSDQNKKITFTNLITNLEANGLGGEDFVSINSATPGDTVPTITAGDDAVAIGAGTLVNGLGGEVVIGLNAQADSAGADTGNVAIGRNSISNGSQSIAIGNDTATNNQASVNTIAIGASTVVEGTGGIGFGVATSIPSDVTNGIAIGSSSSIGSTANNSVLVGANTDVGAGSFGGIILGDGATIGAGSTESTLVGYLGSVSASASNTTAVGANTFVDASTDTTLLGYSTFVDLGSNFAVALGAAAGVSNASVEGITISGGVGLNSTSVGSIAIGALSGADGGTYNVTIGHTAVTDGNHNIAIGRLSDASGIDDGIAIGRSAILATGADRTVQLGVGTTTLPDVVRYQSVVIANNVGTEVAPTVGNPDTVVTARVGTLLYDPASPTTLYINDDGATGWSSISGGGGGATIATEDEGISVDPVATTLNFVGAGVTATDAGGNQTDITIPGFTSPLTTKGDIFTYDTGDQRLAVGTDGQVLRANSATATGLEWQQPGFTSNVETLAATKTLATLDPIVQALDPNGAARDVVLPDPPTNNDHFVIINNSDGLSASGNTLNIKETAAGAIIQTLDDTTGLLSINAIYNSTAGTWVLWS